MSATALIGQCIVLKSGIARQGRALESHSCQIVTVAPQAMQTYQHSLHELCGRDGNCTCEEEPSQLSLSLTDEMLASAKRTKNLRVKARERILAGRTEPDKGYAGQCRKDL